MDGKIKDALKPFKLFADSLEMAMTASGGKMPKPTDLIIRGPGEGGFGGRLEWRHFLAARTALANEAESNGEKVARAVLGAVDHTWNSAAKPETITLRGVAEDDARVAEHYGIVLSKGGE